MKATALLLIFLLSHLLCIEIKGQCTIEQLSDNSGSQPSFGGGQSFIACSDGLLEEIEFKSGGSWTNPFTLELKDNNCNVIWTVSGLTAGTNQIINVDLSSGSGTTRNLTSGQSYSFGIPGSGRVFRFQNTNPYSNGIYQNLFAACSGNSNEDLWFRITIGQILPVELTEFNGKPSRDGIMLFWETASELNNSGFEIQRSNNGRDWEKIDFVEGKGTSNEMNQYRFEDLDPFSGINYYRLKQVDYDGAFEYSKVIAVEYNIAEKDIQVFPNPSNGLINIRIDNPGSQRIKIWITDHLGRSIWDSGMMEGESVWRKEMEIEENGVYFITARIGSEIQYERVIIMKN